MSKDTNLRKKLNDNQEISIIEEELGDLSPLLSMYPEEALDKLIKNKDKLTKISKMFESGGINAVSTSVMLMRCNQSDCPYRLSCPLLKAGIAPEGYTCPIEKKLSSELELTLIKDLGIDPQDTVEMELLFDFIDAKLLDMRTSGMLANTSLVQEITKEGRGGATMSRDVAPEFTIKMDLKSLKSKLLNEFMATRLSKKRYGISGSSTMEEIIRNAMEGNV